MFCLCLDALDSKVACGTAVSYAVTKEGKLYRCFSAQTIQNPSSLFFGHFCLLNHFLNSWGMGTNGQLGTGEEDDVWEPYLVASKQIKDR